MEAPSMEPPVTPSDLPGVDQLYNPAPNTIAHMKSGSQNGESHSLRSLPSSRALPFKELICLLTQEHDRQLEKIDKLSSEVHSLRATASAPNLKSSPCLPGIPNNEAPSLESPKPILLGEPPPPPKVDIQPPPPKAPPVPFAPREAQQGSAQSAGCTDKNILEEKELSRHAARCEARRSMTNFRAYSSDEALPARTTSTVSEYARRGFPCCCQRRSGMSMRQALANTGYQRDSDWVINPDHSSWLMKWDQVTIIALCFVAVITPVEVGMMETKLDWLFVINRLVDAIFFLDMCLQFFLMYPVKTNFGVMMEGNHWKIIKRYLRGWFIIDFMSIQQFDLAGLLMESEAMQKAKVVKVIRLLRLLKLVKVSVAARIFHRIEVRISITYQRLALYKFFIVLLFISHWLACLWAMTLTFVDEEPTSPRWVDAIDSLDPTGKTRTVKDLPALYLASVYFVSYTITSVGYGDIGPVNTTERLVCTCMIFVAGVVWAYVLGQVCGIIGSMGLLESEFRKSMDDLNFMMADRELPSDMRRRLRSFFLSTKDLQRHAQQTGLLQRMSPALQGEVAITTNWEWLAKVPFMQPLLDNASRSKIADEKAPAYIVDIALALESTIYAQSELFGKPRFLYILQKGLISRRMQVKRSGAVWGEDFVLSNPRLVYSATCHALTYVQVSKMGRKAFFDIVHRHKKTFPELFKAVRRSIVLLTAQRGMLLEARQRQQAAGVSPLNSVGKYLNYDASDSDGEVANV